VTDRYSGTVGSQDTDRFAGSPSSGVLTRFSTDDYFAADFFSSRYFRASYWVRGIQNVFGTPDATDRLGEGAVSAKTDRY
jgi:hypothetical protein